MSRAARLAVSVWTVAVLAAEAGSAQQVPIDFQRANAFSAGFAVAESPAFNILEVDGGAILRPTTVKELSTNLSSFMGEDGLSLPREVGIEFSPGLLWSGPDLSRRAYQRRAWWYRTRISLATRRPDSTSTATRLALGLRLTLEDEADLRTDERYIRFVEAFHAENLQAFSRLQDDLVARTGLGPEAAGNVAERLSGMSAPDALRQLEDVLDGAGVTDPATRVAIQAVVDSAVAAGLPNRVDRTALDQFRDSIQNAAWNANALDLGFASLLATDDSTGAGLRATRFNAWLTVARGFGESAQILLGGVGSLVDDPLEEGWKTSAIASVRLYVGSNRLKLLTEGQANLGEEDAWFLRAGTEVSPSFGGWFTLTAGIKGGAEGDDVALTTDFTFGLGLQHLVNSIR